jgi:hypothetical protein
MNARVCKCCGERMPESQNPLCASCRAIEPEPEEHPQEGWKEDVAREDEVLRKVWDL